MWKAGKQATWSLQWNSEFEFNILSIYSALKEAILCDKNVLNEISEYFVDEFIEVIHNVYHKKRWHQQTIKDPLWQLMDE